MKTMKTLFLALPALALVGVLASALVGCSSTDLTTAGVSAATAAQIVTVEADAVNDGQLFCTAAGTLYEVTGINVIGAAAGPVAGACAGLTVAGQLIAGAVPTPATAGQTATVATTSTGAASAVSASKPATTG